MQHLQTFDFLWTRFLSTNTLHNSRPLSLGTLGFPQAKLQLLANIMIPWILLWVRIFAITVLGLNHVNPILARCVTDSGNSALREIEGYLSKGIVTDGNSGHLQHQSESSETN